MHKTRTSGRQKLRGQVQGEACTDKSTRGEHCRGTSGAKGKDEAEEDQDEDGWRERRQVVGEGDDHERRAVYPPSPDLIGGAAPERRGRDHHELHTQRQQKVKLSVLIMLLLAVISLDPVYYYFVLQKHLRFKQTRTSL